MGIENYFCFDRDELILLMSEAQSHLKSNTFKPTKYRGKIDHEDDDYHYIRLVTVNGKKEEM